MAEAAARLQVAGRQDVVGHRAVAGDAVRAAAGALQLFIMGALLERLVFRLVAGTASGGDAREIDRARSVSRGLEAGMRPGLVLRRGTSAVTGLAGDAGLGVDRLFPVAHVMLEISDAGDRPVAGYAGIVL